MIAFALVYHDGERFGVQIDFNEPSVFETTVVCYGEKVWFELQIVSVMRVWTPAFRLPFHAGQHNLFMYAAELNQLNVTFGDGKRVP